MKPFDRCAICNGELLEKQVEKLLRGGEHLAVCRVDAYVCTGCGERYYAEKTVRLFEKVRSKLAKGETSSFKPLGRAFEAG